MENNFLQKFFFAFGQSRLRRERDKILKSQGMSAKGGLKKRKERRNFRMRRLRQGLLPQAPPLQV